MIMLLAGADADKAGHDRYFKDMNPLLREILSTETMLTKDGEKRALADHVPLLEGQILQAWIEQFEPCRFLEIGLAYAISTLFICDAIQKLPQFDSYQVIDPYQASIYGEQGLYNLQRAGYADLVTLHRKPSEITLPQMWSREHIFDFVFIDGDHSFEHVFVDTFYATRMLSTGGIVLFDDIQLDDVQEVVNHLEGTGLFERLEVPPAVQSSRVFRLRRMSGRQESRIVGFRKR